MENPEEVLHSLDEFAKIKPKDIPNELEEYLLYVAATGDPVYQWSLIKCLFRQKLINVITDFYESNPVMDIPHSPNVETFNYEAMKTGLLERFDSFSSAPFTIQRVSELLTTPRKQYNRVDKFMRAIEKNIWVVSTREPGHRETVTIQDTTNMVNGVAPQVISNTTHCKKGKSIEERIKSGHPQLIDDDEDEEFEESAKPQEEANNTHNSEDTIKSENTTESSDKDLIDRYDNENENINVDVQSADKPEEEKSEEALTAKEKKHLEEEDDEEEEDVGDEVIENEGNDSILENNKSEVTKAEELLSNESNHSDSVNDIESINQEQNSELNKSSSEAAEEQMGNCSEALSKHFEVSSESIPETEDAISNKELEPTEEEDEEDDDDEEEDTHAASSENIETASESLTEEKVVDEDNVSRSKVESTQDLKVPTPERILDPEDENSKHAEDSGLSQEVDPKLQENLATTFPCTPALENTEIDKVISEFPVVEEVNEKKDFETSMDENGGVEEKVTEMIVEDAENTEMEVDDSSNEPMVQEDVLEPMDDSDPVQS